MKIIKKMRKAKGFTLVELLIVIIIIGILAGMMMLATGAATDKAEATKIVSNLRNIKAAAVMYYSDNGDWPADGAVNNAAIMSMDNYLDQLPAGYTIATVSSKKVVQATGTNTDPKFATGDGIHDKLLEIEDTSAISVSGDVVTMPIE